MHLQAFYGLEPTGTGCSLNIVFFPENLVIILNPAISSSALVFYLPSICVHTLTPNEDREKSVFGIF